MSVRMTSYDTLPRHAAISWRISACCAVLREGENALGNNISNRWKALLHVSSVGDVGRHISLKLGICFYHSSGPFINPFHFSGPFWSSGRSARRRLAERSRHSTLRVPGLGRGQNRTVTTGLQLHGCSHSALRLQH